MISLPVLPSARKERCLSFSWMGVTWTLGYQESAVKLNNFSAPSQQLRFSSFKNFKHLFKDFFNWVCQSVFSFLWFRSTLFWVSFTFCLIYTHAIFLCQGILLYKQQWAACRVSEDELNRKSCTPERSGLYHEYESNNNLRRLQFDFLWNTLYLRRTKLPCCINSLRNFISAKTVWLLLFDSLDNIHE